MKHIWIGCLAALCMVLAGCAGTPQERPEPAEPKAPEAGTAVVVPAQTAEIPEEPDSVPEDDAFIGRWQAVETPQYFMDIRSGTGGGYAIDITWAGASQGDIVWQTEGSYDEAWGGIAYVGAKYQDAVQEDGTVARLPVPEREEVSGMVYLEEDGTLCWIDDFDHAGDDLHFIAGAAE